MLHGPTAKSVSVLPLTVQTVAVVDVNATVRPALELTTSVCAALPKGWLDSALKFSVCVARSTVKVRETVVAAANTDVPDWLAASVQLPAPTSVKSLPLTVQTAGVIDVKVITRPEVAVAASGDGAMVKVWFAGVAKSIDCVSNTVTTGKLWEMSVAALKLVLPAWRAVTVQVPLPTSDSTVPLTVQTAGVLDEKLTARPELAVPINGPGVVPSVWLPGDGKVMVCAAGATVKLTVAGAAAA